MHDHKPPPAGASQPPVTRGYRRVIEAKVPGTVRQKPVVPPAAPGEASVADRFDR
jgi:hypothetical protein